MSHKFFANLRFSNGNHDKVDIVFQEIVSDFFVRQNQLLAERSTKRSQKNNNRYSAFLRYTDKVVHVRLFTIDGVNGTLSNCLSRVDGASLVRRLP